MAYPPELLPNSSRKLINCDLAGHILIRYTENRDNLWDASVNQVTAEAVCSPKAHIVDLSTSLFGVYRIEHIQLALTSEGKNEYAHYCGPNVVVESPVLGEHYVINAHRGHWWVSISDISDKNIEFLVGEKRIPHLAQCKVVHTPVKHNFWHYSIRWQLADGREVDKEAMDGKEYNKWVKVLSGSARALLKEYAKINDVGNMDFPELPEHCYTREEIVNEGD